MSQPGPAVPGPPSDGGPGPTAGGIRRRHILIGVGAGCGCLSLLGAVVVVVILVVALSARGGGGGGGPQAPPEGLRVELSIRKVEGDKAGPPSTEFASGERLGALIEFVEVKTNFELVRMWVRLENNRPSPVAEPKKLPIGPADQGRRQLFTLSTQGAPAGVYAFALMAPSPNGSRLVASQQFRLR